MVVLYRITPPPLEDLRYEDLEILISFYADNTDFDGSAHWIEQLMKILPEEWLV